MNAIYGTSNQKSKKSLFKTITSVFNIIVVFEPPKNPAKEIVQGYILARNTDSEWTFNLPLSGLPNVVVKRLKPALENAVVYQQEDKFLEDTVPMQDNRNDWKRRSSYVDTAYRKYLTRTTPWQVLLD